MTNHQKIPEWTREQREEYIRINYMIAKFMLDTRAALTIGDFIEKTAPLIEPLLTAQLRLSTDAELDEMRNEVRRLIGDAANRRPHM